MNHALSRLAFAAAAAILATAAQAHAQSDILLRLRSGSPLGDRFRVDSAGGTLALGSLGIGIIPHTGAGERMMWYPFRAIFLAGGVNGTQWDDGNLGFYGGAFGFNTTLKGNYSFVTGYQSSAMQSYSVAMGYTANSNGQGAIAIGYRATANGDYSLALGHRASTNGFDGTFVIADASTTDSLEASATNQFNSRYAGGYRLYSNATTTTGVSINAGGSSWNVISDRNRKELFLPVDGESVLARIRGIPVSTWRYIDEQDRSVRHMGPMAQDWQRAFGFSGDSTTINSGDFDGVNFAGIQALEARTAAQQREIESLRAELAASRGENAALRGDVEALRQANDAMEARLRRLEAAAARTP